MTATDQQQGYPPQDDLIAARVVYREIPHLTTVKDALGRETDGVVTAYGPGHPALDVRNHPELDPSSQEFQNMASDHRRGQLVLLRPHQAAGLIRSGAVKIVEYDPDDPESELEEEELINVGTATIDELADWIKAEKPNANDVVQASDGQAELARKLLEAESKATDGDPRKTVLSGLTAVISRG